MDTASPIFSNASAPRRINIPLWRDFKRNSSYIMLPYLVKIYLTTIVPSGELLEVSFNKIQLVSQDEL